MLTDGLSQPEVVTHFDTSEPEMSQDQSVRFVGIARAKLCPERGVS